MKARLGSRWRDLQDSLWFTPAVITALYALFALALLRVDDALALDQRTGDAWAFGGADGSRGVLFAIAGTMLSVIGVVFSLTVIVLQIASAQFTPRVMRTLTGDRGTQVVLGVFLGTFTYALLTLRAIRSPGEGVAGPGFVPVTAVAVAIALALVSIGFMIFYISHVAREVQVAVIIPRVTDDTLELLDEPIGPSARGVAAEPDDAAPGDVATVPAASEGYLQAIDTESLLSAAAAATATIRTEPLVGTFLLAGAPLATVRPPSALDPALAKAIRAAFVLGTERTRQQDAELGIRQLADIAIKALSPAVNDPTTAVLCIDRLGQTLVRAARRPAQTAIDGSHGGRVIVRGPTFERLTDVAFTQIRRYGAADPFVAAHLMATLGAVAARVPTEQREPLRRQARNLLIEARHALAVPADVERVEAAACWTDTKAVAGHRPIDGDPAAPRAGG